MDIILRVVFWLLTIYTGFSIIYIFVFAIASKFRMKIHVVANANSQYRCVVFIPAYKEDVVILEVAESATKQNYPKNLFQVVVIADSLKQSTLKKLSALPIKLVEVNFEKSTKAKALNAALDNIEHNYDIAYIIDADNIMEADFINKLNVGFSCGFKAVQGHRVAKNTNSPVAHLDAISEEINNSIFRRGHRVLGLSSAFIGSGLAIEFNLFSELMKQVTSVGEDKELEMMLLKRHEKIEYLPDAMVYDEKIQAYDNMVNQRRRWLFAQFDFLKRFFFDALKDLFQGNVDYFDKLLQQALIPRSLLIGLIGLYLMILVVFSILSSVSLQSFLPQVWLPLAVLLVLTLTLATPVKFYNRRTLYALLYLPKGVFVMFISLIKSAFSGNTFFHTKHGVNES